MAVWRILPLVSAVSLFTLPALADLEVGVSVQIHAKAEFEAPLAAHGAWVEVGSYGRCWRPAHVAVGWRPYGAGEWVWTDCGWYWASDEPWGWACYHYGYWVLDPSYGWVWIPGVEWAPAWVSWRVGGGYIGWAPAAPPGWVFASHPRAELFVFVGTGKFGGPVRPGLFVANGAAIFKQTAELGGNKREARTFGNAGSQKVMVNHGPSIDMVQKASGRSITAVPIHDAVRRTAARPTPKHDMVASHQQPDKVSPEARSDRGPDRADSPGKPDSTASPEHGSKPDNNGGLFGGRNGGGRSGGGGHGRH